MALVPTKPKEIHMKLTDDIKRMLNALAYANAGDYLSLEQKSRVLSGAPTQPTATAEPQSRPTQRTQVGLYLGSELPQQMMQYVVQTCTRLKYGLTVFTFLSEAEAQELLTPLRPLLDAAGVDVRLVVVGGEPPADLANALRRRPEVAFLVCNESGYLGHGLVSATRRNTGLPVPVVLVAASDTTVHAVADAPAGQQRAA
jgi:hypothetical protein